MAPRSTSQATGRKRARTSATEETGEGHRTVSVSGGERSCQQRDPGAASSLFLGTVGTRQGPARPGRTLTFSSKVKATRDGYSLSAMTTPARLSLRT